MKLGQVENALVKSKQSGAERGEGDPGSGSLRGIPKRIVRPKANGGAGYRDLGSCLSYGVVNKVVSSRLTGGVRSADPQWFWCTVPYLHTVPASRASRRISHFMKGPPHLAGTVQLPAD